MTKSVHKNVNNVLRFLEFKLKVYVSTKYLTIKVSQLKLL